MSLYEFDRAFLQTWGREGGGEEFPASVSCNKGPAVFWFSLSVKIEKVSQVIEIGTGIQITLWKPSCRAGK